MTDNIENPGVPADDMAEYLQTFLDETEEQLDDLVETMLALEDDSTNKDDLNEAFRLIHCIKGSAGMMGFDNITVLTHHLENRFERFRSGPARLDEPTMNLVLRCIDFLRQCNNRLRAGQQLGSSAQLLDELRRLEEQADASETGEPEPAAEQQKVLPADTRQSQPSKPVDEQDVSDALIRMVVKFRTGLQLADLKAQLIVARLAGLGDVKSTLPDLDQLSDADQLEEFEVRIETHDDLETLHGAADVHGVEAIEFVGRPAEAAIEIAVEEEEPIQDAESAPRQDVAGAPRQVVEGAPRQVVEGVPRQVVVTDDATTNQSDRVAIDDSPAGASSSEVNTVASTTSADEAEPRDASAEAPEITEPKPEAALQETAAALPKHATGSDASAPDKVTTKVAETMRVDIDRLDNLMNLAGELVVNRARFLQISGEVNPALRKASMLNRVRDFSDSLRRTIESMENVGDAAGNWSAQIQQLRSGLELMDEQADVWDNGRHCFSQIGEAINQFSRVSHSLQRGVLDTRMVSVGPLFNRFKRVVRDLSKERGKQVHLQIRGEKTELDKRMIDELGDPLVHLVRNSIDHGLEPPDARVSCGKPEAGTIFLEASHSGNNVYIHVRDDGAGIDAEKIKAKLISNRILTESAVDELSDDKALDYIWHPGFSTAKQVTDVSGRGVGMDVVKTRINQLNGTVEVDSTPQQGTTFTIRLPLTLAIVNSLLVRMRNVIFSMPIDDVREIVSMKARDVVTVHGKQTFDVRGEFLPLVAIDDVFQWHGIDCASDRQAEDPDNDSIRKSVEVVILHTGGKTLGLRVDDFLGSQDIVIKSLSDNFINIQGLSGASILGDGSVCLMLDVGTVIDMVTRPPRTAAREDVAT